MVTWHTGDAHFLFRLLLLGVEHWGFIEKQSFTPKKDFVCSDFLWIYLNWPLRLLLFWQDNILDLINHYLNAYQFFSRKFLWWKSIFFTLQLFTPQLLRFYRFFWENQLFLPKSIFIFRIKCLYTYNLQFT